MFGDMFGVGLRAMSLPILYSKNGCQQCVATARWLDAKGVEYEYRDAGADESVRQEVADLGYMQVPVVVANGDHWYGFNPGKLDEHFAVAAEGKIIPTLV